MSNSITVFRQILQLLPKNKFNQAVRKHEADKYVKRFFTWKLLVALLYAQITGKDSLRDIETGILSHKNKLYHLGVSTVSRSNLSYSLKHRSCQVFEELFYHLLKQCASNARSKPFRFNNPIYALDSTLIDLCLSLFPWAKYRTKKGAIKLHYLLDLKRILPVFLLMTEGKKHDIVATRLAALQLSSDSIIVYDRAYIDFEWFYSLDRRGITFVTRAKKNLDYTVLGQHSLPSIKNIISDEVIELKGVKSKTNYPKTLRLVTFYDKKNDKILKFLTNNFKFAASTIAKIYQARWKIETFFKWIKQNLKIKTFYGTSKNAVMLQIWAAMIYYLLLSYIKFQTEIAWGVLELSRRIKAVLFENKSLLDLLSQNFRRVEKLDGYAVQLELF